MTTIIGTRCVLFWFAALFPPASENDIDYYEVLGVTTKATKEEIRKAYKKKSLALHPDKILQRGGNPDDYRVEYQAIQEAHVVLCDDKKRQTYNLVNRSSTRYKFLTDEGALATAYENLVKSTCEQKSRLVLLMAIILGIFLLQPILVCVKINQELEGSGALANTAWTLVLFPWWILCFLYLLLSLLVTLLIGCDLVPLVNFIGTLSSTVGQVLLALRWDQTLTQDYVLIFIPFYVAMALRWLGHFLVMRRMSYDILHMITIEKLEEDLGKSYQDLTEEEQEELGKEFIIVHVPTDMPTENLENSDFVKLSPEYQGAMEAYYQAFAALVTGILFGTPLVVMIVLKVDYVFNGSWWVVFIPVWIYLGVQLLWNCYSCCCSAVGEPIIIIAPDAPHEVEEEEEIKPAQAKDVEGFVDPKSSFSQFSKSAETCESISDTKSNKAEDKAFKAVNQSLNMPASDPAASMTQPVTSDAADVAIDNNQDDGEHAEMDEETYNKFHQAYQQAEANAAEAQAKAASNMCPLLFQLVMMCLVVGKLDQDVPDDGEIGYNALWIIFPIFLVAGCTLCCWACLIYGAGLEGLDHLVERAAGTTTGESSDEEAPKVPENHPQPTAEPAQRANEDKQPAETTKVSTGDFSYDDDLD
jgi:curved DNA-binding protein